MTSLHPIAATHEAAETVKAKVGPSRLAHLEVYSQPARGKGDAGVGEHQAVGENNELRLFGTP